MENMSGDRTKERVASTAWWPKWEQELSEYINTCEICQKANRKHGKKYGLLQHIKEPKHPWETINMDCITGLVPGGKENLNAFLIIVYSFRKSEPKIYIRILDQLVLHAGTNLAFSTAYHPQTDGLAERMIRTMEDILRRFCAYGMEYKDHEGYTHYWVASTRSPTGKNEVEVRLTEELSRKHLVFPVSLVRPYFQIEEDTFPSRKKNPIPPGIVEGEDSIGPVKKIIKARNIRLNGKDQRKYLVRFKNQTADKDKWLTDNAMPDWNLYLRKFRASRRTEQSHQ
ncbi:hypothetical protein O181_024473 [Austropuccinia psidii MF-1]|uniref:Integrase zinc-binding domain-containing protein n=1 Tax=Austropuccinia psidii MF-1 TaxID=1389203 RepID=A0A9Q3CJ09_9BASI|nr:hypothetical protein [Austropuccinia psidii MF-1]